MFAHPCKIIAGMKVTLHDGIGVKLELSSGNACLTALWQLSNNTDVELKLPKNNWFNAIHWRVLIMIKIYNRFCQISNTIHGKWTHQFHWFRITFNSDNIKCNTTPNWHKNLPIILIYRDVNNRSAFHETHALAVTNGISRLQKSVKWFREIHKGTKRTQGKSKHDHTWMHMLVLCQCPQKHTHTHVSSRHTHTPSLRRVRQHRQPCPMTHTKACVYPSSSERNAHSDANILLSTWWAGRGGGSLIRGERARKREGRGWKGFKKKKDRDCLNRH